MTSYPFSAFDHLQLKFGELRFMEEIHETVEVANTGQVDTLVEFVAKLDDKSPCKPWLKVEPQSSFLMPGMKTFQHFNKVFQYCTVFCYLLVKYI